MQNVVSNTEEVLDIIFSVFSMFEFEGRGLIANPVASWWWDDLGVHLVTIIPLLVLVMTKSVIAVNFNLVGGYPSMRVSKVLHYLAFSGRIAGKELAVWCKVPNDRVVKTYDSLVLASRLLGGGYAFRSLGVKSGHGSCFQRQGSFNFQVFSVYTSAIANLLQCHCKFQVPVPFISINLHFLSFPRVLVQLATLGPEQSFGNDVFVVQAPRFNLFTSVGILGSKLELVLARMELLCEDLIIKIMSKLSEKDLMRCKCVSKEWHRIITHVCIPKLSIEAPVFGVYFRFARFTCNLREVTSNSPPDVKMQLHNRMAYDDSVHSMDCSPLKVHPKRAYRSCALYDTSACESMYYASILPFDHRGPDFLDCCNGLLLFVRRPKPQFYVCNPAIKQCVPIPLPPPTIHLPSLYASLAFDPSESIHFRIVISSLTTQPQCLHIFYSQTGEWMTHEIQVKLLLPHDCFRLLRHCVYFKGMLYRLSLYHRILCFDLETKTACIFASPNKVQDTLPGCLGVLAGSLSYAKEECGHLWVWLRDSHSEPSVWILKYKLSLAHICDLASRISIKCFNVWLHPYAFHPKSDILFVEIVRKNGICNILCGSLFSMFTYTRTIITLKNWRKIPCELDNFEDVLDDWCFTEQ